MDVVRVLLALLVCGCFAEVRGGYYPSVATTETGTTTNEGAFVLGFYLGVRVDVFGVAVAAAPKGAGGSTPMGLSAFDGNVQLKGNMYRADIDVPLGSLADGLLRPRLTLGYDSFAAFALHPPSDHSVDYDNGSGAGWFGGLSLAAPGGFYSVALGPSYVSFDGTLPGRPFSIRGWGVETRLMIAGWFPSFFRHYNGSMPSAPTPSYQTCTYKWAFYGYSCY